MTSVEVNLKPAAVTQPKASPLANLVKRPAVLSLILAIATIALYCPVHHHPFVNYDDGDYVYQNRQVQSGLSWATLKWALTTSHAQNWHPLTWLSHALDWQLFGDKPAGPHDVNVILHVLDAVLLFWVLLRATGFPVRSFMVAVLFALHPINVESVAWIAERKNVLSMMFFLLALGAYRRYASGPRVGRYAVVAALFALGLMAKPQIITLPCVLLLWDYWPLQRMFPEGRDRHSVAPEAGEIPGRSLRYLVIEKIPLFAIAAVSAAITLNVQHAARSWFPRRVRAGNGIFSYGLYLWKAIWPARLTLFYPHPGDSLNWWKVSLSGAVLLLITAFVIAGRRHRYLPVGWFWFIGTLVPMLGIVQVGMQAMADRYAYVSFIGLFIIVCWGMPELAEFLHLPRYAMGIAGIAAILTLAVAARRQLDYWQTEEGLWRHALEITTRNWIAEGELGTALAVGGRVEEAVPHFYNVLAIAPTDTTANMGLAIYELKRGRFHEAIGFYQLVVKEKGTKTDRVVNAWIGMAKAYFRLGENQKAQECLQTAKRLQQ